MRKKRFLDMPIRKATVSVVVLSFLVSAVPVPALAQAAQHPVPAKLTATNGDEAVIKLFDAFPNGGAQLTARVADAIESDPDFAYRLVQFVRSSSALNAEQKAAAELGFAEALKRLQATMGGDLIVPAEEPRRWGWLWLLIAGGTLAGLCIGDVICDDDDKRKVSPN